jgi:hypothetical protein
MVIPMQKTWHTRYNNVTEFLAYFESEQDYVDAMFIHMIMWNYGIYLDHTMLYRS